MAPSGLFPSLQSKPVGSNGTEMSTLINTFEIIVSQIIYYTLINLNITLW